MLKTHSFAIIYIFLSKTHPSHTKPFSLLLSLACLSQVGGLSIFGNCAQRYLHQKAITRYSERNVQQIVTDYRLQVTNRAK